MSLKIRSKMLSLAIIVAVLAVATGEAGADVRVDAISPRITTADAGRGKKLFLQCKACHVSEKGARATVGPNLWGIVNRPVASMPGFAYTDSLAAIEGQWDYEKLSRYLFDPKAMAPETRMIFDGIKPAQDRADLIAYLRTLAEAPAALPEPPAEDVGPVYGNLPEGEGREAVYFTCRACHSLEQFTDRSLSREEWDDLLEKMVASKGMASPEPWARELMVNYLTDHFGPKQDWQGLPPGAGRDEVFYTCNACHSLMLVTQQGMSRDRWDETLDWMVEEQGMSEIKDDTTRNLILDYLATHFGSS